MQIVPSTFIALIAIAALAALGPRRGLWAFLALTPLGAAAAFNLPSVGGASIGLVQFAVVALCLLVCLTPGGPNRVVGTLRPGQPGFWVAALLVYCTFSALYAPSVFRGATEVFSISRDANARGIISLPLRPSNGNITQLFSMTLSVLAFLAFATIYRRRADTSSVLTAMAIATGLHFALGWTDVLSHAVGLQNLLDPIRTANYAILDDHRMIGMKRMIGGFPEASSFGAYSLGLFAFWLHLWLSRPNLRLARIMLLASLVVLLRSTSSGAYAALIVFVLVYGGWAGIRHLRTTVSRSAVTVAMLVCLTICIVALAILAAYHLFDPFTAFLDRSILNKLETRSGVERMSWNAQAFRNFLDTGMMGAGLGSVRASNWLLACLGSIGLIGTALFLTFLYRVFRMPADPADQDTAVIIAALKTACLALFLSDLLTAATPNLGVFFFALAGVATGLARGQRLRLAQPHAQLPYAT